MDIFKLEQKRCGICNKLYDTGKLALDLSLDDSPYTIAKGYGRCQYCDWYLDHNYLGFVEIDSEKNPNEDEGPYIPEDYHRTGKSFFVPREMVLNPEIPATTEILLVKPGFVNDYIDKLNKLREPTGKEPIPYDFPGLIRKEDHE